MRCREGVIDIGVAELSQGLGEFRVVRLLALVKAQVFEQRDVAGLQPIHHSLRLGSDAVGGEVHCLAADRAAQRCDQRA